MSSPENISRIHCSCSLAMASKLRRPLGVRLTIQARRSSGLAVRETTPSRSSSSVRPVTLPPVTIR